MKISVQIPTLARVVWPGILIASILVALALPAYAANIVVDSQLDGVDVTPGDGFCDDGSGSCTLRGAIMEANASPGADTITLPAGTYTLLLGPADDDGVDGAVEASGDLDILLDDLILNGAGSGTTIIEAGTSSSNGIDRVFDVDAPFGGSGLNVTITGVTIRNGQAPAPSGAGGDGGGIRFFGDSGGTLTLTNCVIQANTAEAGLAGGVEVTGGSLNMSGTTIQSNTASAGAGGGVYFDNLSNGNLTISGGSISSNQAMDGTFGNGGGVYIVSATSATFSSLSISNNSTALSGGGLYQQSGSLSLNGVTIANNTAGGNGSGVYAEASVSQAGAITLTGNDYYQASGAFTGGSAAFNLAGTLTLAGGSYGSTSGTLSIGNDFVVNSGASFDDQSGTVRFNGATTQNLVLNTATAFYDLTVDNGTTLVETVSADNASVGNTLTNNGTIRKAQAISALGIKTFGLTGVSVNVTDRTGGSPLTGVSVDRIDSNSSHGTGSAASGTNTGRYWLITPTGSDYTLNLTLPHDYPGDHANTQACKWIAGSGFGWSCARDSSTSTSVTRNGITALSEWAVGYTVGPTAVTLHSFEAGPAGSPAGLWLAGGLAFLAALALLAGKARSAR